MASGRLGAEDLVADTNTLIYTVPADTVSTVIVYVCNRDKDAIPRLRIAHLDGGISTLSNEDFIEYDVEVKTVLERAGIVMAATHTIVAYSDLPNVTIQVCGWEESV